MECRYDSYTTQITEKGPHNVHKCCKINAMLRLASERKIVILIPPSTVLRKVHVFDLHRFWY